jgi:hypothetical protein
VRGDALVPATVAAPPGAAPGTFVFDLGADIAGHCGLDLAPPAGEPPAPAGVTLQLLHGEALHANGSLWNHYLPPGGTHQPDGLNQPRMNFTYTTRGAGAGNGEFMSRGPLFSYYGFRYVELRGWPYAAPPAPARLACVFLHTELPPAGAAAFPDTPAFDALQAAVIRTHAANWVSVPTDCPQREKRGWSGDAQLTARSAHLNFEALAAYESWHGSILDQQRIGCLPAGQAPGPGGRTGGIRPANWACDAPTAAVPNLTLAQYQYGPVSDVVPREQVRGKAAFFLHAPRAAPRPALPAPLFLPSAARHGLLCRRPVLASRRRGHPLRAAHATRRRVARGGDVRRTRVAARLFQRAGRGQRELRRPHHVVVPGRLGGH